MSADKRQLEQYYAFLAGHIDEVRRMQHDILHHLRVMSGYAQAGDYDRLKEYLDALVEQMPDMDGLYYCGDHAANILLKYYGEQEFKNIQGKTESIELLLERMKQDNPDLVTDMTRTKSYL